MLYLMRKHFAISPDLMCSSRWLRAAASVPEQIASASRLECCAAWKFVSLPPRFLHAFVLCEWVLLRCENAQKKLSSARLKLHITLLLL
jgi:hypothetical protein